MRKAIIPAAGCGIRLRPITQIIPKELFPIARYPAIEWVIAEAIAGGYTDIAIVISYRKRLIQDYLLHCCDGISDKCHFTFVMQTEPLGLGHALLLARDFCAGQPFAVLLPDDLLDCDDPPLLQMAAAFEAYRGAVFWTVMEPDVNLTGHRQLQLKPVTPRTYQLEGIGGSHESGETTPAQLAGVGRYLLSNSFLNHTAALLKKSPDGELDDTLILQRMLHAGDAVHCVHLQGNRFDVSTPKGYVAAWQKYGEGKPAWRYL